MDIENFLEEIVAFINEVRGEARPDIYQMYADRIAGYYYAHRREDVPGRLKEALGEDAELYSLVLFVMQLVTEEIWCIDELWELARREDIDLFAALDILFQIANISFRDTRIHLSYEGCRNEHRYLLERIETEHLGEVEYLPYAKRNRRRIVIATDLLLGELHAPSKIVYRMAGYLHALGYETAILVNTRRQTIARSEQYCLTPYYLNRSSALAHSTSVEYEGNTYPLHQYCFSPDTMEEQKELLSWLYQWKPLCVWYIGGASPVQDIYRRVVTQISMGCTDGYLCSEAPVLVGSYMQSGSQGVVESIRYAGEHGQKIINIKYGSKYQRENFDLTRKELGIPEDSFALCIVGNRLDGEMSLEFIDMLQALVESSLCYHIVLIGECRSDLLKGIDETRYSMLGFRHDLVDAIAMTDLFVNPPRQGGGSGAVCAFAADVPVVTYPYCDVSNVTGADFCCQNLTEMRDLIQRYASDRVFYQSQQEKLREVYRAREKASDGVAEEVRQMLDQVDSWLQCGEII